MAFPMDQTSVYQWLDLHPINKKATRNHGFVGVKMMKSEIWGYNCNDCLVLGEWDLIGLTCLTLGHSLRFIGHELNRIDPLLESGFQAVLLSG